MNRTNRDALHSLLSAVVDATASEAQVEELARILQSDADARRFYVRYMDMHAALSRGQLPHPVTTQTRRMPWPAAVAALVAATLLIVWLVVPSMRRNAGANRAAEPDAAATVAMPTGYVATIASASADAILDGRAAVPGARLTPGAFRLTAGGVNIRFDGGARILLEGTSRFSIDSRRAMRIHEGTFVFHGDQTCESIEIVTPHSVFKNIGTRYAAVIDSRQEEVHVAEGAVRRTTGVTTDARKHELIEAGAGRRYDVAEASVESIPLNGALVTRSLEAGTPAPPLGRPAAVDDFRGGAGQIRGLKSGRGWVGPWESRRGALRLMMPGLSGPASTAVVHDGSAPESAEKKAAAHRGLESPIDFSTDGIWYLRFLVRRSACSPRDEHRAMVVLRTRGLTTQAELEQNALVQLALRKHDGIVLRVGDTLARASLPQIPDQVYAVVAKIVTGKSQPDQVLVSLMAADRLTDSTEPAEWSIVSEDVHSDLRFERLSLEFTSGGQIAIGDVCIGPSWESVAQPLDR